MEATMAYQKLKQIFPNHCLENVNLCQITSKNLDSFFDKRLPHLPIDQLHSLCRTQEKNVMDKVLEVKQMDLYDEMAHVCPNKDLKIMRSLSNEQVNQKIHHYSSQMALAHEKEMQNSTDQSDDNMMDIEENMEVDHQNVNGDRLNNQTGLRNIFEEYDQHFSWNELNIYDLH